MGKGGYECLNRVMNHMPLKGLLIENDAKNGAFAGTLLT